MAAKKTRSSRSWISRRGFLKGAGALLVVAFGGATYRVLQQHALTGPSGAAWEPWNATLAGGTNPQLNCVAAAILAANPHNTQPWLFRVAKDRIDIFADAVRNLGDFDAMRREMRLGLGCALENLVLAARANSFAPAVSYVPDGQNPDHVACVKLNEGDKTVDDRFKAIPLRHTNRYAYDKAKKIDDAARGRMKAVVDDPETRLLLWDSDSSEGRAFHDLTLDATMTLIGDRRVTSDSQRWIRARWNEIQEHRDGVTLFTSGASHTIQVLASLTPEPSEEKSNAYWLKFTRDLHLATASLFGAILVRELYDSEITLRAGRLWQRLHLEATSMGLAMQPLNQALELIDLDKVRKRESATAKQFESFAGGGEWRPTFAFRAGYPLESAPPSPRRSLSDVLLHDG
jgi:nitroreductase